MNEQNPIRWRDPGSGVADGLREVMDSAALDEAGPDQLARFASRMDSLASTPPGGAGNALLPSGKVMAGLAMLVGGAALFWVMREQSPAAAEPTRTPAVLAETERPTPRSITAHVAPAASAPEPSAAQELTSAPAQESARVSAPRPVVEGGAGDSLAEEVRLLQAARESLAGDPAGSLRLAEQHRSRFPRGALTQEREALAIEALLRQGRTPEAQGRADRFRRQYPRSSHLDRLTELSNNPD